MSKVSIIVPVHNTEQYLDACIASITAQTLNDIEIILVENASTDHSLERCHQLAQNDKRIRVMHLDKGDLSSARNAALKIASSPYIAFVDSDDTILPDMYQTLYDKANEHHLGMVICNFLRCYDNKPDKYPFSEDGSFHVYSNKEMTSLILQDKIPINACTVLFKRQLLEQQPFPEDMYFEDRAITYAFAASCQKGGVLNHAFYKYYQRNDSICRKVSYEKYRDFAIANRMRLEFIAHTSLFDNSEKALIAQRSADSLLRKLRHAIHSANTATQKEEILNLCQSITLIPSQCHLTIKARLIRAYIRFLLKKEDL